MREKTTRKIQSWEHLIAWLSLFVSFTAVVFSQISPLREYFWKPRLEVTLANRLAFDQSYGFPFLQWFVEIENFGRAAGTVEKTKMLIAAEDNNGVTNILEAFSYIPPARSPGTPPYESPLGKITIDPKTKWEGVVIFGSKMDYDSEKRIRQFELEWGSGNHGQLKKIIEWSKENAKQRIVSGKYHILFTLWQKDSHAPHTVKIYECTIRQSDIDFLYATIAKIEDRLQFKQLLYPPFFLVDLVEVKKKDVVDELYKRHKTLLEER